MGGKINVLQGVPESMHGFACILFSLSKEPVLILV